MDPLHRGDVARVLNHTNLRTVAAGGRADVTRVFVRQIAADGTQPGRAARFQDRLSERFDTFLRLCQQMESQPLG